MQNPSKKYMPEETSWSFAWRRRLGFGLMLAGRGDKKCALLKKEEKLEMKNLLQATKAKMAETYIGINTDTNLRMTVPLSIMVLNTPCLVAVPMSS